MKVLIIEDEPSIVTTLRAALEQEVDMHIDAVPNLRAALAALSDNTYDIAVLDPGLPDAIPPLEAYERITAAAPNLPIVAYSGAMHTELADIMAIRGLSYIVKPGTAASFYNTLKANIQTFEVMQSSKALSAK